MLCGKHDYSFIQKQKSSHLARSSARPSDSCRHHPIQTFCYEHLDKLLKTEAIAIKKYESYIFLMIIQNLGYFRFLAYRKKSVNGVQEKLLFKVNLALYKYHFDC